MTQYFDTFYDFLSVSEILNNKNSKPYLDTGLLASAVKELKNYRGNEIQTVPLSFIIGEEVVRGICGERTYTLR